MKGLVHFHSAASFDSGITLDSLQGLGLDFVITSEHYREGFSWEEYVKGCSRAPLLVFPGLEYELCEAGEKLHILAYGAQRVASVNCPFEEALFSIKNSCRLAVLAHPGRALNLKPLKTAARALGRVEVWNRKEDGRYPQAVALSLAKSAGAAVFAGDDTHSLSGARLIVETDGEEPLEALARGAWSAGYRGVSLLPDGSVKGGGAEYALSRLGRRVRRAGRLAAEALRLRRPARKAMSRLRGPPK